MYCEGKSVLRTELNHFCLTSEKQPPTSPSSKIMDNGTHPMILVVFDAYSVQPFQKTRFRATPACLDMTSWGCKKTFFLQLWARARREIFNVFFGSPKMDGISAVFFDLLRCSGDSYDLIRLESTWSEHTA